MYIYEALCDGSILHAFAKALSRLLLIGTISDYRADVRKRREGGAAETRRSESESRRVGGKN